MCVWWWGGGGQGPLGPPPPLDELLHLGIHRYTRAVLSRGLTGHAGETAIFMLEIGVKCWRFITLFLMLNISTDLP